MAECKAAGRHKRSPAMATYRNGNRSQVNQDKKVARHKKRMEKHRLHLIDRINQGKPQRGDARMDRRHGMPQKRPTEQQRTRERFQRNNIVINL